MKKEIQLPTVIELPYKFVVMFDKETQTYILRGHTMAKLHSEIVRQTHLPNHYCKGGGRIVVKDNLLHAYGRSVDFGTPSDSLVESLLSDYCKDKGLSLKVTMGVGY